MSDTNTTNYSDYTHYGDAIGVWLRDDLQKAKDDEHEDYTPYTRPDGTVIGART